MFASRNCLAFLFPFLYCVLRTGDPNLNSIRQLTTCGCCDMLRPVALSSYLLRRRASRSTGGKLARPETLEGWRVLLLLFVVVVAMVWRQAAAYKLTMT